MSDNIKARCYCGVWYPEEDLTHLFALNKLEIGYQYCACDHDKDIDENGELKKKHTHVFIRLPSARYRKPLADELGIDENYLQPCSSAKAYMKYLIHFGEKDKYEYETSEVYGNLKSELEKLIEPADEGMRVLKIVELLDSLPTRLTYKDFLIAVCRNGLYGEFRRLGVGAVRLLEEHQCRDI